MKKKLIFSFFTFIVIVFSLTSCSKSYNCHCVYKSNGTITREDDHKINEGKKEKSAAACNNMDSQSTTTLNGVTTLHTTECELN